MLCCPRRALGHERASPFSLPRRRVVAYDGHQSLLHITGAPTRAWGGVASHEEKGNAAQERVAPKKEGRNAVYCLASFWLFLSLFPLFF